MHTPILDSQISRALVQPTPWEVAQWRAAALRDKAEWSKLIDIGSSHRFCDDVQRSVDTEIRRERMWCGPAPCVAAAAPVPTELARNEFYRARNLFSWARLDYQSAAGGKVTAIGDKVALAAEGAVVANARAIDPAHSFAQPSSAAQVASAGTSALINGREIGAFTFTQWYPSTIAASNWKLQDGTGWQVWSWYVVSVAANQCLWGTSPAGATQGVLQYAFIASSGAKTSSQALTTAGAASFNSGAVGTSVVGTPTYLDFAIASAGCSVWQKTTLLASGPMTSPSVAAPTSTMTLGSISSSAAVLPLQALLAEVAFANVVSATLQTVTRRYSLLRYAL